VTDPGFHETLRSAQRGAAWACTLLYESLVQSVVAYVRLRGAADPDDVTSETFLCVFRDLGRFQGEEADFRAWVFTVARHRVVDAHRRASRRPPTTRLEDLDTFDAWGGDAECEAVDRLALADVVSMLGVLTEDQRDVVLLRLVADMPLEDTARILGLSVSAVKARQHRAVTALRRASQEASATSLMRSTVSEAR
jgi:RNA polymerase sigma factor (sigma-70 family)